MAVIKCLVFVFFTAVHEFTGRDMVAETFLFHLFGKHLFYPVGIFDILDLEAF